MRFQRKPGMIVLMAVLAMVGAVHAQGFKPPGEIYATAPITGQVFRCYVSNVSDDINALVLNVRIYNGRDGSNINKGGAGLGLKDCKRNGVVLLLPHETCGVVGAAQQSGSSAPPDRTAAHCQFRAVGFIRGSLQSHLSSGKDTEARLRADAKRTNTD